MIHATAHEKMVRCDAAKSEEESGWWWDFDRKNSNAMRAAIDAVHARILKVYKKLLSKSSS
jgi:hypothetical protein